MEYNERKRKWYVKRHIWTKVIIAFTLTLTIVFGTFSYSKADSPTDYSFYTLSSVATSALSSCAGSKDANLMNKFKNGLNPNSAGGLLGYQDTTKSTGIVGLLSSAISGSAVTYNYEQLCSGDYSTKAGVRENVFSAYCALGACLSDLGIDQTATEVSATMMRKILGGLAYIAYTAAQCVCIIFKLIIKLLKLINPFQFFYKANDYIHTANAVDHMTLKPTSFFSDKFDAVTVFVSTFYGQLYDLGTVVVALCFVALVVSFFMSTTFHSHRGGRWSAVKKFLIRASFIVFGIPLLGGTYTALLDHLDDDFSGGNTAAAKVIASTFCDFEGWVMSGMELPTDLLVKYKNGHVTAAEFNSVQDICYKMNQKACISLPKALKSGSGSSSILYIIEDAQTNDDPSSEGYTKEDAHKWVIDVISRYMTGKKIYATNFEQNWIAEKWTTADKENLAEFIEKIDTTEDILGTSKIYKVWKDSNVKLTGMNKSVPNPFGSTDNGIPTADLGGEGSYLVHQSLILSPMAVYNYLNSTFDETSIKVYSSEKSSSTLIRDYHYSVTLVGKGITSVLLFLLCITILFTYALLGFVYGFGIIMTNFKRGVKLITAVPGAMLGSVQSVSKIISYTVLMILELIINIVLYGISTELLYSLAYVVAQQFNVHTFSVLGFSSSDAFVRPIICFVVIVFLIWFCIQCIKLRKPIIKSLEEMADNVVRQFVLNDTGGGSMKAPTGGGASGSGGGEVKAAGAAKAELEPKKTRTFVGRGIEKMQDTSKSEAMIGQMFGGNGSAFEEEQAFEQRRIEKKAARKNARREKMEAGKKAVIGAGKVAAGAVSGNAMLAADGGKDLLKSASMANQASENQYQANLAANTKLATKLNPNMAKYDKQLGYTKGQAKPVEKVTMETLANDIRSGAAAYTAGHDLKEAYKVAGKEGVKTILSGGTVDVEKNVVTNTKETVKADTTSSTKSLYSSMNESSKKREAKSKVENTSRKETTQQHDNNTPTESTTSSKTSASREEKSLQSSRHATSTKTTQVEQRHIDKQIDTTENVSLKNSYGGAKFHNAINTMMNGNSVQSHTVNDTVVQNRTVNTHQGSVTHTGNGGSGYHNVKDKVVHGGTYTNTTEVVVNEHTHIVHEKRRKKEKNYTHTAEEHDNKLSEN